MRVFYFETNCVLFHCSISFKFGLVAMLSGLIGVPLGPFLSQLLRSRFSRIDPLICAAGLILSAPICFFAILSPTTNKTLCYVLIFLAELFLNLNWSIVADILLVRIICHEVCLANPIVFI